MLVKRIILIMLCNFFIVNVFCQKNNTLGIETVIINSATNNQDKKNFFDNAVGLQVYYRNKIAEYNYVNYSFGLSFQTNSQYHTQLLKIGYEAGNVFGIKNLFVMPEIFIRRFTSDKLDNTQYSFGPSLGTGYNYKITQGMQIRILNTFEYNIPAKIATVIYNINIGLHFKL